MVPLFYKNRFLLFFFIFFICSHSIGWGKDTGYILGTGDEFSVSVYENPDLSGDFIVGPDGNIVFPLLGSIQVKGKTLFQVRENIRKQLEKDYLVNPIVNTRMKAFNSRKVKILGQSMEPSIHNLQGQTHLLDLLLKTKRVSITPDKVMKGQKIRVIRRKADSKTGKKSEPLTIRIDLYDLLVRGSKDADILLQDGDLIYLPPVRSIHVVGEVIHPGAYPYEDGISVLLAIAKAGGPSKDADMDKAVVKRIKKGKEIRFTVKTSDPLQPDDVLQIPGKKKMMDSINVIGEVKHPGSYQFEKGMTVLKAITNAGGPTRKASVKNTIVRRIVNEKEVKRKVKSSDRLKPGDVVEVPLSFW